MQQMHYIFYDYSAVAMTSISHLPRWHNFDPSVCLIIYLSMSGKAPEETQNVLWYVVRETIVVAVDPQECCARNRLSEGNSTLISVVSAHVLVSMMLMHVLPSPNCSQEGNFFLKYKKDTYSDHTHQLANA